MDVLVVGIGVIGSYLAHALCVAGNDVTVVARGSWGKTVRGHGLVIRHVLQRSTTVDHPNVLDAVPTDRHFDVAFSVMGQDQQVAALPELAGVDCDLLVLVGNDLRGDELEAYLEEHGRARRILFGFQSTAGNRAADHVDCFRVGAAGLDVGSLHGEATDADRDLLGRVLTGRYQPHWTHDFDDWLASHAVSILPLCFMSYLCGCDLHKASNSLISRAIAAEVEACFLLERLGYQILPESDRDFHRNKAKLAAWHGALWLFAHTPIGTYCIDDHCRHAPQEMRSLDQQVDRLRACAPEFPMPEWDRLRTDMGSWERVCQTWDGNPSGSIPGA